MASQYRQRRKKKKTMGEGGGEKSLKNNENKVKKKKKKMVKHHKIVQDETICGEMYMESLGQPEYQLKTNTAFIIHSSLFFLGSLGLSA